MTNSPNFHSSETVLISLSFMEDIYLGYKILHRFLFVCFLLEKYCATFPPWLLMRKLLSF